MDFLVLAGLTQSLTINDICVSVPFHLNPRSLNLFLFQYVVALAILSKISWAKLHFLHVFERIEVYYPPQKVSLSTPKHQHQLLRLKPSFLGKGKKKNTILLFMCWRVHHSEVTHRHQLCLKEHKTSVASMQSVSCPGSLSSKAFSVSRSKSLGNFWGLCTLHIYPTKPVMVHLFALHPPPLPTLSYLNKFLQLHWFSSWKQLYILWLTKPFPAKEYIPPTPAEIPAWDISSPSCSSMAFLPATPTELLSGCSTIQSAPPRACDVLLFRCWWAGRSDGVGTRQVRAATKGSTTWNCGMISCQQGFLWV